MILLFRKIRQKLLTQNKFSKYLLYAIGEIALVMIGILLALQINNRNEDAKNRATEATYLSSLHQDFLSNKEKFSSALETFEEAKIALDSVYKYNLIMTDSNWDQMRRWINHAFFNPQTFEPMTGTIDGLLSSGRIELIQNDTLKRLILSWNDVYQDYVKKRQVRLTNGINFYNDFRRKYPNVADPQIRNSIDWQMELESLLTGRRRDLYSVSIKSKHRRSSKLVELMNTIDAIIALTAPENK